MATKQFIDLENSTPIVIIDHLSLIKPNIPEQDLVVDKWKRWEENHIERTMNVLNVEAKLVGTPIPDFDLAEHKRKQRIEQSRINLAEEFERVMHESKNDVTINVVWDNETIDIPYEEVKDDKDKDDPKQLEA